MGSKNGWLLGGLLLAAGVGYVTMRQKNSAAPELPTVSPGDKVLIVGDSLAQGLAPQFKSLATATGCDTASITEVGTVMKQWLTEPRLSALQKALSSFTPTVVLVSLGTNDNKTSYTDDVLTAQITDLLALLRSGGAKVVWMLAPPMPFPDRVGPLLAASGVSVVDTQAIIIPRGPDNIHPTARGYAAWAALVWDRLAKSSVSMAGFGKAERDVKPSAAFAIPVRLPKAVVRPKMARGRVKKLRPKRV